MPLFTPRHPLLKAIVAIGSALWYVFQWRRGKKRTVAKIVDATGVVVEERVGEQARNENN